MFKALVTISLIFILVLNTVINTFLFLSLQQDARKRIKKIIKGNHKEKKIDTIRVPLDMYKDKRVFRFVKEDFYLKNLYDIKRIEERNDSVIIFCINDTYEAQVIKNFLNAEKNENSSSPLSKVLKILTKFSFEFILTNNKKTINHENIKLFSTIINLYKAIIINKIDHPPRHYFSKCTL